MCIGDCSIPRYQYTIWNIRNSLLKVPSQIPNYVAQLKVHQLVWKFSFQKAKPVAVIGPLSLWVQNFFITKVIHYVQLLLKMLLLWFPHPPFLRERKQKRKEISDTWLYLNCSPEIRDCVFVCVLFSSQQTIGVQ